MKKIILGTAQIGMNYGINNSLGKPSKEKSFAILSQAYEKGIRILDTAEGYGDAQEIIGEYHKHHRQNTFKIISKFCEESLSGKNNLRKHVMRNLEILHVVSFEGYMFHTFQDFKEQKNHLDTLVLLKKEGKIKKIGVSLYTNEEVKATLRFDEIDFIQIPYNLLDNINQRNAILEECKNKKIEIHARSVFLQGIFFCDKETLKSNLEKLKPYLLKLEKISQKYNMPLERLALGYVKEEKRIDHFLMGVDSEKHLIDNLNVIKKTKLTQEITDEINNIQVKETTLLNPTYWN